MKKIVTLYPEKENIAMSKRQLRVAAYCRVSTEHEEQDGSVELQENYFRAVIDGNRNWTNAGIFTERTTGLKLKNRKQFNAMIRKCKSGKIDLILSSTTIRMDLHMSYSACSECLCTRCGFVIMEKLN